MVCKCHCLRIFTEEESMTEYDIEKLTPEIVESGKVLFMILIIGLSNWQKLMTESILPG